MNGLRSPDIPAYVSYAVVLIVGAVVALTSVNILLAEKRDRWAYAHTWLLFVAYALFPVLLFWLLDYNSVMSDTSLFAAVVTAGAYQYIFSGAVEGIRMPGQTAAIWRVFELWVERVEQRIDRLNQARHSKMTERILSRIAPSPNHLADLEQLATQRSLDPIALGAELGAIRNQAANLSPERLQRDLAKRLWDDIRRSSPDTYGDLMRNSNLVDAWTYWGTFRNGRAVLMSIAMLVLGIGGMALIVWVLRPLQSDLQLSYHEWRFVRPSPTAADEFRTRRGLLLALTDKDSARVDRTVRSLTETLTHRDLALDSAERILDLILFAHDTTLTPRTILPLVAALRAPNSDVRLRIHRTLKDLQAAEYSTVPLAGEFAALDRWVPGKGDSAGAIDGYMRAWRKWWNLAQHPAPANPVVEQLQTKREFTPSDLLFDSGLAALKAESIAVVQQVAQALQGNPEWAISIVGHTDDVGSNAYNLDLSKRRAAAVVDYIKTQGINESRLKSDGKGETEPLVQGTTEDARRKNRRVVFTRVDNAS